MQTQYEVAQPHASAEPNKRAQHCELLQKSTLFRGCSEIDLDELMESVQVRRAASGGVLVAQGGPQDAVYVLVSGQAKVVLLGENGREITLAVLRPGDLFGELSLLDGAPPTGHLVAMTETQVLSLARSASLNYLQRYPQAAFNLLTEVARRLRRADETIAGLALQDVEVRLMRTLTQLAREDGGRDSDSDGSLTLRRRPTQQELANMVGSTRETVSRALTSMAKQGLMVARGRSLVLTEQLLRRGQWVARA